MDIGFIRGPKNLAAVLARTEEAAPKVIESRHQGYVCYLLIIDNTLRYTWPFSMKSKSVPLPLIKIFLETHGNDKCTNHWIRTDGEGSLAICCMLHSSQRAGQHAGEDCDRFVVTKWSCGTPPPDIRSNGLVSSLLIIPSNHILGGRAGISCQLYQQQTLSLKSGRPVYPTRLGQENAQMLNTYVLLGHM